MALTALCTGGWTLLDGIVAVKQLPVGASVGTAQGAAACAGA